MPERPKATTFWLISLCFEFTENKNQRLGRTLSQQKEDEYQAELRFQQKRSEGRKLNHMLLIYIP